MSALLEQFIEAVRNSNQMNIYLYKNQNLSNQSGEAMWAGQGASQDSSQIVDNFTAFG